MKIALFITFTLFLITMASTTRTHASIIVENNVTTVTNTNTDGTSKSHVRIETNGKVNEFNTSGNETVDWKSEDGKSTVKINSNGTNIKTETSNDNGETAPTTMPPASDASPSPKVTDADNNDAETKSNFSVPLTPISMIVSLVKSLFSLL